MKGDNTRKYSTPYYRMAMLITDITLFILFVLLLAPAFTSLRIHE